MFSLRLMGRDTIRKEHFFVKTKSLWSALLRTIGVGGIIPLHSGAGETIAVLSVGFGIKRCGESCFLGVV